jgi:bifunctional DNA-binding transcriptional regulator/antitoxin component of YhaV-PrlF toxin-antitoxin module
MNPSERPALGPGPTEDPLTLRVGSRGRLTIPPQALAALGWKPGDTLLMTLDEQGHLTAQKKM